GGTINEKQPSVTGVASLAIDSTGKADSFATLMLGTLLANCFVFGAAEGTGAAAPFPDDNIRVSADTVWGPGAIRSPEKRMPQNPTAGSVNSNSTYPLTFR